MIAMYYSWHRFWKRKILKIEPMKKKLILVQLNRFGDILQSLHSAIGTKNIVPDISIEIVVREQFGNPLCFLLEQVFDKIHYLKRENLIKYDSSLKECCLALDEHISSLDLKTHDVVLNLSFCKTSSFYMSLLPSQNKLGRQRLMNHSLSVKGDWFQYVYGCLMTGTLNPFNLVDLFRFMIGHKDNLLEIRPKACPVEEGIIKIIVHPFASIERKRWSVLKWREFFVQSCNLEHKVEFIVVGSKSEQKEAEQLFEHPKIKARPSLFKNLVGETSIKQLHELVDGSHLFIGHDSMVGHLAALTGTSSITVSLGSVRPIESTPYLDNNLVLSPKTKCFPCFPDTQCDYFACHNDISPSVLKKALKHWVSNKKFVADLLHQEYTDFELSNLNIEISQFSNLGLMQLTGDKKEEQNYQATLKQLYRYAWLFTLREQEEQVSIPRLTKNTKQQLENLRRGLEQGFELNNFGIKFTDFIKNELIKSEPDYSIVTKYSKQLDEVEQLFTALVSSHSVLDPLFNFYLLKRSNIKSSEILDITIETQISFRDCNQFLKIIYELIGLVLEKQSQSVLST